MHEGIRKAQDDVSSDAAGFLVEKDQVVHRWPIVSSVRVGVGGPKGQKGTTPSSDVRRVFSAARGRMRRDPLPRRVRWVRQGARGLRRWVFEWTTRVRADGTEPRKERWHGVLPLFRIIHRRGKGFPVCFLVVP